MLVDQLARAGVGTLVLVDRDIVEWTNLQRQTLYDERHAREGVPKAIAAAERVAAINAEVRTVGAVEDLTARNAHRLAEGCDLILDGLDNFEARYLLNDLSVAKGLPYLYGGAVGTTGMSLAILPSGRAKLGSRADGICAVAAGVRPATDPAPLGGPSERARRVQWSEEEATPCLRCLFPAAPPPGTTQTCDTAGVLGPVVAQVAAHQALQAIKLLVGDIPALDRRLLTIDGWLNECRWLDVRAAGPDPACPCCALGQFDHLLGASAAGAEALCGRDAVQVTPVSAAPGRCDLADVEARLRAHGRFLRSAFLLRGTLAREHGELGPIEITLFTDGRAIIRGTRQSERARAIYARYIGG
jgi:adenylyltransferase/sulfurtransferase